MPKPRFVTEAILSVALAASLSGVALTQEKSPVQIVGDRQKAMRDMQVPNGYIQGQLRGANPDWATIAAQADVIRNAMVHSKGAFPDNTKQSGPVEGAHVRAKDLVWTDWPKVAEIFDRGIKAADDLKAAAQAQNKEAATAAIRAVGATCSECHVTYRDP